MNKLTLFFLLGMVLCGLVLASFVYGAYYACNKGGGTLYSYTCYDAEKIGTCEDIKGNIYKVPEDYRKPIVLTTGNKTLVELGQV